MLQNLNVVWGDDNGELISTAILPVGLGQRPRPTAVDVFCLRLRELGGWTRRANVIYGDLPSDIRNIQVGPWSELKKFNAGLLTRPRMHSLSFGLQTPCTVHAGHGRDPRREVYALMG